MNDNNTPIIFPRTDVLRADGRPLPKLELREDVLLHVLEDEYHVVFGIPVADPDQRMLIASIGQPEIAQLLMGALADAQAKGAIPGFYFALGAVTCDPPAETVPAAKAEALAHAMEVIRDAAGDMLMDADEGTPDGFAMATQDRAARALAAYREEQGDG